MAAIRLETGVNMAAKSGSGSNRVRPMRLGARPMRLAMIFLELAGGGTRTAAELAEATGCGRRTVYRDIETLRGVGLDIEGTTRLGYRLTKVPELAPLFLTRAERSALAAVAPAGLKAKLRGL